MRDHQHCWELKSPACGLKGEHKRCCLCGANPTEESHQKGEESALDAEITRDWNKADFFGAQMKMISKHLDTLGNCWHFCAS